MQESTRKFAFKLRQHQGISAAQSLVQSPATTDCFDDDSEKAPCLQTFTSQQHQVSLGDLPLLDDDSGVGVGVEEEQDDLTRQHLTQTIQSLLYLQQVTPKSIIQSGQPANIPGIADDLPVLIYDLDETLVHCFDATDKSIRHFSPGYQVQIKDGAGEIVRAGVNLRPFALECLRQTASRYLIGIFTASNQDYADAIIDQVVDPKKELIKFRLYRQNCLKTCDGVFIKDLTVIENIPLKRTLIVDNTVHSFGFQLDNGIPLVPFYDDERDQELIHLASYVMSLANTRDMVKMNGSTFNLKQLQANSLARCLAQQNCIQERSDDGSSNDTVELE